MGGGIIDYRIVNMAVDELIAQLQSSLVSRVPTISFTALHLGDPAEVATREFTARVETIHVGGPAVAVDLIDEFGLWFQVKLDPEADAIEFGIAS